jgi:hypothetical protein
MKSINKKTSTKKIILISVIAILFALAGIASAYFIYRSDSPTGSPSSNNTKNGITDNKDFNNQPTSDSGNKEDYLDNESTSSNPGSTPNFNSDKIVIDIKQTTSAINISTKLNGFSGLGNCELKLTRGSSVVTSSAEVIYQSEYSTCAGFSVEKSKLSAGTWSVNLAVKTDTQTFSQTGEFTIE